ncbi:MAG: LysR family transcriptional regulator [Acidimicrobiales bacterium]
MLPPDTPDLTALDLLGSVAELGSLGRAAGRHRMSQPAVSMRMSQLERRLGLDLLRRDPSGTRLTPAGDRVMAWSHRVLDEMQAMMAAVSALRKEGTSTLRVAASLTVAEHLVPGWLGMLNSEFPEVNLTLDVTNSAMVQARVARELVDIGFVEGSDAVSPGTEMAVVKRDRLVVVVSPGHPWSRRQAPVGGAELAATELIVRESGSGTRQVLEVALEPWGGIRSRLQLGSTAAILGAARRGEGPAVLSAMAVAEDLGAGRLVVVDTVGIDLARELRAVWSRARPLSVLAQRLLSVAGT